MKHHELQSIVREALQKGWTPQQYAAKVFGCAQLVIGHDDLLLRVLNGPRRLSAREEERLRRLAKQFPPGGEKARGNPSFELSYIQGAWIFQALPKED